MLKKVFPVVLKLLGQSYSVPSSPHNQLPILHEMKAGGRESLGMGVRTWVAWV